MILFSLAMLDVSFAMKNDFFCVVVMKITTNLENTKFLKSLEFTQETVDSFYKPLHTIVNFKETIENLLVFLKLPLWNVLFYKLIALAYKEISNPKWLKMEDIKIPDFAIPLLEHQQTGVKFLLTHKKAILGDMMGLGKTATTIATLVHLKKQKNMIVCPKSLSINWKREFVKFVPGVNEPVIIKSGKKCELQLLAMDLNKPNSMNFVILSYGLLKNVLETLKKLKLMNWDIIVADEAHFVKHRKSQRSKVLKQIAGKSERVILLSATIAHKPANLWNPLRFCNDEIFEDFHINYNPKTFNVPKPSPMKFRFAERFISIGVIRVAGRRLQYEYKIPKRLEELNLLIKPFVLRRCIDEVVELPPLIKETIIIGELSVPLAKKFKENISKMEKIKNEENKQAADIILMDLMRTTSKLKQPMVLEYLLDLVESYHDKILVFFHHIAFGDFLEEGLKKAGISNIKVHSGVASKLRQDLFDQFVDPKGVQVGLISLGVGSTGLNFTCCNLCVYADLSFDIVTETQSEGRCRRIGQTKKVVLQFLQLDSSTDEMLIKAIHSQQKTSFAILDA